MSSLRAAMVASALPLLVGLVVGSGTARASHYRLSSFELVTETERAALTASGIETTRTLLDGVAFTKARESLSKATDIGKARLVELATQCDLLRVAGIGPTMVRVLQAAGVRETKDLSAQGAAGLLSKMQQANARVRVTEVLPGPDTLADWIAQARRLPRVLQGIR